MTGSPYSSLGNHVTTTYNLARASQNLPFMRLMLCASLRAPHATDSQSPLFAHHCVAVHSCSYRPCPLLHHIRNPGPTFLQNPRTSCGFHARSRFFFINARPMRSVYLRMRLLHVRSAWSSRFVNASRVWFRTIATDPHFEFLSQQERRRHVDGIAVKTAAHHCMTTACRRIFIGIYGKAAQMDVPKRNGRPWAAVWKKLRNLLLHRR